MNRSKKGGTPRGGARCPYCKTFYRHGSMARACQNLYLSGERFWISAQTKAEAREILRVETGLVGLPVKGIALGERLSDGRTAGELLSLAGGKPGIIALAQ